MANLQVAEEEEMARKFLQGNSETKEHSRYLANRCGVFLTNARLKVLKVTKLSLPP